jgi:hypothetical protein
MNEMDPEIEQRQLQVKTAQLCEAVRQKVHPMFDSDYRQYCALVEAMGAIQVYQGERPQVPGYGRYRDLETWLVHVLNGLGRRR